LPVSGIHNIFFHHLLFWIVAVILLIPLAARFGHIARVYVEEIFLRIPVLGKYMRKIIVLELAASMSSCLATGHGIVEAADFSLASTRRPWLKAKLRDFRKSVCDGQDWADAWMEMKLGIPIADWMVRNSARREKPVEGFDTLLKWLCHDVAITSVRHVQWIEVAGIFFNGILVTMFALALFGSLILIINHLATVW
jgi:type II secretory pathway component PulF